jgi:hypothetical protein
MQVALVVRSNVCLLFLVDVYSETVIAENQAGGQSPTVVAQLLMSLIYYATIYAETSHVYAQQATDSALNRIHEIASSTRDLWVLLFVNAYCVKLLSQNYHM